MSGGAPARITKKAVRAEQKKFSNAIDRALTLYDRLAENGFYADAAGRTKALPTTDRRDVTEYLFFEVAARFEAHVKYMFSAEVRSRMRVKAMAAEFVMGRSDGGRMYGWTVPSQLVSRAENLFQGGGYHARLESLLGGVVFQRLADANTVRNRIAHSGGAGDAWVKLLKRSGFTKPKQRQGLGPGRFLREYPTAASATDRHFHRLLAAFRSYSTEAARALP